MLANALFSLHRALLFVALVVSLTATGFAHRVPTAQDGALAFALANGAEASDFCGGVPGNDGAADVHCPACQITASADLPLPSGQLVALELAVQAQVIVPHETLARRSIRDPAHTSQGPPTA